MSDDGLKLTARKVPTRKAGLGPSCTTIAQDFYVNGSHVGSGRAVVAAEHADRILALLNGETDSALLQAAKDWVAGTDVYGPCGVCGECVQCRLGGLIEDVTPSSLTEKGESDVE